MAALQAVLLQWDTKHKLEGKKNKRTAQVLIPFVLPSNSAGIKLASYP